MFVSDLQLVVFSVLVDFIDFVKDVYSALLYS